MASAAQVFARTAKGDLELSGNAKLSVGLLNVLNLVNGESTVAELSARAGLSRSVLESALEMLLEDGMVKLAPPKPRAVPSPTAVPAPQSAAKSQARDESNPSAQNLSPPTDFLGSMMREVNQGIAKNRGDTAPLPAAPANPNAKAEHNAERERRQKMDASTKAREKELALYKAELEATERAEREAKQNAEANATAKAKELADAKAHAEKEAKLRAQAEAKAKDEEQKRLALEAQIRVQADAAQTKLKAETEARAREEEARRSVEEAARIKAEAKAELEYQARLKAEADAKVKEAELRNLAQEAETRAQVAAAEAKLNAETAAKAREEELKRLAQEAESRAQAAAAEARLKAEAEAEAKAREDEAHRRAEEEARLRIEAQAQAEADYQARVKAEARAKEEELKRLAAEAEALVQAAAADAKFKADAEARAREEEARSIATEKAEAEAGYQARIKAEADVVAKEEELKQQALEAEARAKAAAEAARLKAEADARAREEELKRLALAEARAKAAAEAARLKAEAEAKAREEEEKRLALEAEARAQAAAAEARETARLMAEAKAQAEAEYQVRLEMEESKLNAALEAQEHSRRDADELLIERTVAAKNKGLPPAPPADFDPFGLPNLSPPTEEFARPSMRETADSYAGRIEPALRSPVELPEALEHEPYPDYDANDDEISPRESNDDDERANRYTPVKNARQGSPGKFPWRGKVRIRRRGPGLPWGKIIGLPVVLLIVAVLAGLHLIPQAALRQEAERMLNESLGVSVSVSSATVELFPSLLMRFEGVTIGKPELVRVNVIKASPDLQAWMNGTKSFRAAELGGVSFGPDPYASIYQWLLNARTTLKLPVRRIVIPTMDVTANGLGLKTVSAELELFPEGGLRKIAFASNEGQLSMDLEPQDSHLQLSLSAQSWRLPGTDVNMEALNAAGRVKESEFIIEDINARAYGGRLEGKGTLRWGDRWRLNGTFKVDGINLDRFPAAPVIAHGNLVLNGVFDALADVSADLLSRPKISGKFSVQEGKLSGIDITRALNENPKEVFGGMTPFKTLDGAFLSSGKGYELRDMRLSAGPLNASGHAILSPTKELSGRIATSLSINQRKMQESLRLSGTAIGPRIRVE